MKISLLLALFGIAFASEVLVITEDNFDKTLADNENILVEFYAPWCGHCKKLEPEYNAAAKKLADEPVALAKVDATEHSELAGKFEVRGYPTLIWFKNGKKKEYDGGRTTDTIVSWIMKKIGPVLKELADADAVAKFKESAETVVLMHYAEGAAEIEAVKAVAEDLDQPFGIITDAAVAKEAGVDGVVVFKTFDEPKVEFSGDIAKDLATFVKGESVPLVMEWSKNQDKMGMIEAPLLFAVHDGKAVDDVKAAIKTAATEYKGQYLFYVVDATKPENSRLTEYFGVEAGQTVVFDQENRKKYFHKDSFDGVKDFIGELKAGSIQPTFKSEEIPADNSEPVFVLVGKEFDKIVKDSKKDVLVEFYAPWCGHCKKLAPIYDKLGAHYKDDENIVIAKMDSTANEVESPEVRGFPTLYFFPADNKEGVQYEGGRELDDFIKYIDENRVSKAAQASGKEESGETHDEL